MRQRAEAQANRLGFLMLFPTIFCLLVAAAIILIGPAYFEFWQGRADTSTILNGAASELRQR